MFPLAISRHAIATICLGAAFLVAPIGVVSGGSDDLRVEQELLRWLASAEDETTATCAANPNSPSGSCSSGGGGSAPESLPLLRVERLQGLGRGGVLTRELPSGATAFSVPQSLWFSAGVHQIAADLKLPRETLLPGMLRLAAAALLERRLGVTGPYGPWVATWPSTQDMSPQVDWPFLLKNAGLSDFPEVHQGLEEGVVALYSALKHDLPDVELAEVRWAWYFVQSRAANCGAEDQGGRPLSMIPGVDILYNHFSGGGRTGANSHIRTSDCALVAGEPLAPGTPLLGDYGTRPCVSWLLQYGFVPEGDAGELDFGFPVEVSPETPKWVVAERNRCHCKQESVPRRLSPISPLPLELLCCARVAALTDALAPKAVQAATPLDVLQASLPKAVEKRAAALLRAKLIRLLRGVVAFDAAPRLAKPAGATETAFANWWGDVRTCTAQQITLLRAGIAAVPGDPGDDDKRLVSEDPVARAVADAGLTTDSVYKALLSAAQAGDEGEVRALVTLGIAPDDPNADATPLGAAVASGHLAVAKLLLGARASPAGAARTGATPLHRAAEDEDKVSKRKSMTSSDKSARSRELAGLLIEHGAPLDASGVVGDHPLHSAARGGSAEFTNALLQARAVVDARNDDGCTPLHLAMDVADPKRSTAVAELLLKSRADANARDNRGRASLRALAGRALEGRVNLLRALLDAGAERDVADGEGRTALHLAAQSGNEELARLLLEQPHGANASVPDKDSHTPMHIAASGGHVALVQLLLAGRSNPLAENSRTRGKLTPLHVAVFHGHAASAAALLGEGVEHGESILADARRAAEHGDQLGRTPLHIAAEAGHGVLCELLAKHVPGAISRRDGRRGTGKTPVQAAIAAGHGVLDILLES